MDMHLFELKHLFHITGIPNQTIKSVGSKLYQVHSILPQKAMPVHQEFKTNFISSLSITPSFYV